MSSKPKKALKVGLKVKGGKSLRKGKRVDYKKMNLGKEVEEEECTTSDDSVEWFDSPQGPSTSKGYPKPAPPRTPEAAKELLEPSADLFVMDYEAEMKAMQAEYLKLEQEEKELEKKERLESMRRELEAKREKVTTLKGTTIAQKDSKTSKHTKTNDTSVKKSKQKQKGNEGESKPVKTISKSEVNEVVDITTLRKDKKLKALVRKELKKMGLVEPKSKSESSEDSTESESTSSSSSSSSLSSSDDESTDSECRSKSKKKTKKKLKSGINAKASDKVKFPQEWPHAHLQYEHVDKQMKFKELTFRLFVAGELEIISGEDLTTEEKQGRLKLLKKIVYYSSTYEFEGLKAYYAAWLRDIELGLRKWSDDPHEIESAILTKHLLKSKSQPFKKGNMQGANQNTDRVWFCSLYQRNKCSHKSSHLQVIKGKQRMATHICATCWQKDKKKLEHPECSSACPHVSA